MRAGRNTAGDFALLNVMMVQLYQPLNFMGMVYREIKQAIVDIGAMFDIWTKIRKFAMCPARPISWSRRARSVSRTSCSHYDADAADSQGRVVRGPGGSHDRHRRPFGRGQVDDLAAAVPLLRAVVGADHDRRAGHRAPSRRASLRQAIGMVPQDTVLFNDTILYNIGYGRDGLRAPRK